MFGLFKQDYRTLDSLKYQMIAVSASSNALAVTMSMLAQTSKSDVKTLKFLYSETLAFAVSLAQARIQKKFKVTDGHDIAEIIQKIQQQFRELPVPRTVPQGQDIAVTRDMVDIGTTDEFFELVSYYVARDYKGLNITDEALDAFCGITRQIPSVIKGAGWTMMLLMFQMRTSMFILEDSELNQRLGPVLKAATEGCQFMMDKFDHVLSK